MPPGVSAGKPVEAFWDGHRVAGEEWGDGPRSIWCTGGAVSARIWRCSSNHWWRRATGSLRSDLPSHNESDPGLAPGRTTAIECANAIAAMIDAHGPLTRWSPTHSRIELDHAGGGSGARRSGAWSSLAPMGEFPLSRLVRDAAQLRPPDSCGTAASPREADRDAAARDEHDVERPLADHPPLLLIHDPDDPDSPFAASERVAWRGTGSRLMATKGLGRLAHYRILRHRPAILAGSSSSARHPRIPSRQSNLAAVRSSSAV